MDGNEAITATITALAVMHSVPHSVVTTFSFLLISQGGAPCSTAT
jgi:hypothetical protein